MTTPGESVPLAPELDVSEWFGDDDGDPMPVTLRRYRLEGTPSSLVIDRVGRFRSSHLGAVDDLALGFLLGQLLAEGEAAASA